MLEHSVTIKLIEKAQNGDQKAKETLINENLPLIKSIVKRYLGKNVEYDDLMQLGTIGLLKAIGNFNVSFDVKFSTYAVPMISGEIKRFIRDDGSIKVSRSIKSMNILINKYIEEERNVSGKEPTIKNIADKFNLSEQDVVMILDSSQMPVSIYSSCDDNSNLILLDRIADTKTTEDVVNKMLLHKLIKELPKRDKQIIILRYYRNKTQSEIAKILGVSQVQVSRLEAKILENMKKQFLEE